MFNLEVEQEILGIILNDNKYLEQVINTIDEENFYDKKHKFIFTYMKEVYAKGERVNVVTLSNHIGVEKIMEVGGVSYLSSLREGGGSFNIEDYLKIIKSLSVKRKMVSTLRKSVEELLTGRKSEKEIREEIFKGLESSCNIKSDLLKEEELMKGVLKEIKKRYLNGGDILGMKTGYDLLDRALNGLKKGELVVLAGRPGMGKTAVAINIADGLAENGHKVMLHELEMTEDAVGIRLISKNTMIKHRLIQNGKLKGNDFENIISEAGRMAKRGNLYLDCNPKQSILSIRARIMTLKQTKGVDVVIIDYLGLMDMDVKDTKANAIGELTRGLKLLAKELDINIIILCQLSRGVEQRNDRRPLLSDLRDSGSIEQDADAVIFTYRDSYYKGKDKDEVSEELELIIAKNRSGRAGIVRCKFYPEYQKIA
ncbi:replicative DNA helicase [uncultured Clostridium sp.]|uniref:replicative DNA helicase n=1 Tax=uncultured Clostridium sp. TaxID=59620 RepID=UPI00262B11E0|nr:replicative DNA helicase [uncultured Clostridium sp.]